MKRYLDDQAKIFSLSFNKKYTAIFRITVKLLDKIDKKYLDQAATRTMKTYKDFRVKLQKGFLWHYLEENNNPLPTHEGIKYNFTKVNTQDNNEHLIKISYQEDEIALDFFHLLTDGITAREFTKELLYNYLRLCNHKLKPQKKLTINSENAYLKYYTNEHSNLQLSPQSYQLKGEYIPSKEVSFNDFHINLNELKRLSKEKECSLSILLISLISYSLYETNYKKHNGTKPINLCIPVNLKNYFVTDTITNFVSHFVLSILPTEVKTFNDMIDLVKQEYTDKMVEEKIKNTFEANGKLINNKVFNLIPLVIKRPLINLCSLIVKRQFTMTISNLGPIEIEEEYSNYIDNIIVRLLPDWAERTKCAISTYKDDLIISFGSNLLDTGLESKFQELLDNLNVTYSTKNNKVNPIKKDS